MDSTRPAYRPPPPPKVSRHPTFVYWRRRITSALLTGLVVVVLYYAITLVFSLTNQSYGPSMTSRVAEWGRAHGLGVVVSWAENLEYRWHPAIVGGTPPSGSFGSSPVATKVAGSPLPIPQTVASPAGASLAGEGVWHLVGKKSVSGVPSMYEAFVRPDAVHTSYVDAIVWMDPSILKAQLYSGTAVPGGGPYLHSAPIRPSQSKNLAAAFDAGFPLSASHGGYFTQGKVIAPLRKGAASVVIYKDGSVTVGKWGRDATMSNQVSSVRQNLDLIVDNATIVKGLATNKGDKWDSTLGPSDNVWRSGIGVTRDGAILYVAGPGLSLSDLATIFINARAVRAMELNVGADWVQFSSFTGPMNTPVTAGNGSSVIAAMTGDPNRYFSTWWTRDFFTMKLRNDQVAKVKSTTTTKKKSSS